MKITIDNYIELALRTESPTTPEMKERFKDGSRNIIELMNEMIALGQELDVIKKYLFYGKKPAMSMPVSCDRPEVITRLQQPEVVRLLHCAIGMATETGELFEALETYILDGNPLDTVNIGEELGDLSWYQAIGINECQRTLQQVLQANHDKLAFRYPQAFTETAADIRNTAGERKILEDTL